MNSLPEIKGDGVEKGVGGKRETDFGGFGVKTFIRSQFVEGDRIETEARNAWS